MPFRHSNRKNSSAHQGLLTLLMRIVLCLILLVLSACSGGTLLPTSTTSILQKTSTIYTPTIPPTVPATRTPVPTPKLFTAAKNDPTQIHTPIVIIEPTGTFVPSITSTPGPLTLSINNIRNISQLSWWGMGTPNATAWSPDGTILAVGSSIGIYLYETNSFNLIRFIYSGENVGVLAFSPDGKRLATGSKRVRIWDVDTGESLFVLKGDVFLKLTHLSYSPGGTWLAAIGIDGEPGDPPASFFLWDASTNQLIYQKGTEGCGHGTDFEFSPDGQMLAWNFCGYLSLLKTSTGDVVKTFYKEFYPDKVAFVPDGKKLIVITTDQEISYLDIVSEQIDKVFSVEALDGISLNPDGETVMVFSAYDGQEDSLGTQFWDIKKGQLRFVINGTDYGNRPTFGPDGRKVSVIMNSEVQIWNVESGQLTHSITWDTQITSIAFGPVTASNTKSNLMLIAGNEQGQVHLINPINGKIIKTIKISEDEISSVAIHPNGQILAVGISSSKAANVLLYDVDSDKLIRTLEITDQPNLVGIWGLAFSMDGAAIAAKTDPFYKIEGWNINSGERLRNPEEKSWGSTGDLTGIWNGHLIGLSANCSDPYHCNYQIRDENTGEILAVSQDTHETDICQNEENYSLSYDRRFFALGCDLYTLPIWDLTNQKLAHNIYSHRPSIGDGFFGNITDIAFSPYGYLLATSGYDQTIRFWDASSGQLLLTLSDHTCQVTDIAFSPDGRYLASTSCDGTLRLWGIQP